MMKNTQSEQYKNFARTLQSFFEDYLVRERNVSGNTIRSYRDTFVLLLDFMNEALRISADKITFKDFDRDRIIKFLDWIQEKESVAIILEISDMPLFAHSLDMLPT